MCAFRLNEFSLKQEGLNLYLIYKIDVLFQLHVGQKCVPSMLGDETSRISSNLWNLWPLPVRHSLIFLFRITARFCGMMDSQQLIPHDLTNCQTASGEMEFQDRP